jgi:hypothetical protein
MPFNAPSVLTRGSVAIASKRVSGGVARLGRIERISTTEARAGEHHALAIVQSQHAQDAAISLESYFDSQMRSSSWWNKIIALQATATRL